MAAPLSPKLEWELANPIWAGSLNPVINNPIVQGQQISGLVLFANTPMTVNHGLNRMQKGAIITPFGNAVVWISKPFNAQTITLESSADVVINLWNY